MTRTELTEASSLLESAAGDAEESSATRLRELSQQLDTLAEAERGPDHGRLARVESALGDVQSAESDDVAAEIEQALDEIRTYRETLDGV